MAESIAVVFQTFPGREQLDPQNAKSIAEVDGYRSTLVGRKLEDPGTFVLYTEWNTTEAALNYVNKKLFPDADKTFVFAISQSQLQRWSDAVRSPTTEIFTAFGTEDGFTDNLGTFLNALDKDRPEGFHGGAFGTGVPLEGEGDDKLARAALGWESRDAHAKAKENPGVLQDNIHLVRALRRDVDLFHVQFTSV
ncbi:hypothetical protein MYCTH_2296361 [Thermothelomyces thermophilus ATCC 42464]|uniref:ABM domain-containing protein n=1 Tax=Thermothelomyces thermophilus (strain ATCC 42464 / BCRC 31852 / DSM 1799) TaxID=573729 RepID=G2Q1F4_THET4|nr:uncharacterized protein MYCTH_2296361 [Thermothelomyces thermophilus ATCC 42464]AEO54144.1 hypothetical protein MYCTH_2296361 [Thermothelomyces thermophilus ATCC 42464]